MLDPELDELAQSVIRPRLSEVGSKITSTQASIDGLVDKSNDDGDKLIATIKAKVQAAKDRRERSANSAQFNSFIAELGRDCGFGWKVVGREYD